MPATILTVADAVRDAINAATLSFGFVAERLYLPIRDAKHLRNLKVSIVPAEITATMLSRRDDDFDYVIDVGIQRKVSNDTEIDELMGFAEEVVDLFRGQRLDSTGALCVTAENAPIYSPDHLDEHRVFTSVVRLTFRLNRAR